MRSAVRLVLNESVLRQGVRNPPIVNFLKPILVKGSILK